MGRRGPIGEPPFFRIGPPLTDPPIFATRHAPPARSRQAHSADIEATGEHGLCADPPMCAPHGTELSAEVVSEARGGMMVEAGQPGMEGRNEAGSCWGAVITGECGSCTGGFKPGSAHMKNKFCDQCRAGFTIPAERVCALIPEDMDRYDNTSASGVWKRSIGVAARYRLINQTLHCRGPKLLIFEGPAPTDHRWGELPPTWVWPGGLVRLRTAYGTLVPIETNNVRSRKRWHEDSSRGSHSRSSRYSDPSDVTAAATAAAAAAAAAAEWQRAGCHSGMISQMGYPQMGGMPMMMMGGMMPGGIMPMGPMAIGPMGSMVPTPMGPGQAMVGRAMVGQALGMPPQQMGGMGMPQQQMEGGMPGMMGQAIGVSSQGVPFGLATVSNAEGQQQQQQQQQYFQQLQQQQQQQMQVQQQLQQQLQQQQQQFNLQYQQAQYQQRQRQRPPPQPHRQQQPPPQATSLPQAPARQYRYVPHLAVQAAQRAAATAPPNQPPQAQPPPLQPPPLQQPQPQPQPQSPGPGMMVDPEQGAQPPAYAPASAAPPSVPPPSKPARWALTQLGTPPAGMPPAGMHPLPGTPWAATPLPSPGSSHSYGILPADATVQTVTLPRPTGLAPPHEAPSLVLPTTCGGATTTYSEAPLPPPGSLQPVPLPLPSAPLAAEASLVAPPPGADDLAVQESGGAVEVVAAEQEQQQQQQQQQPADSMPAAPPAADEHFIRHAAPQLARDRLLALRTLLTEGLVRRPPPPPPPPPLPPSPAHRASHTDPTPAHRVPP